MTTETVIDYLEVSNPPFPKDVRLLLAGVPGLTRYHHDRVGMHAPCHGAECSYCNQGFRLYKASVYFLLLEDGGVKVVLLDDREKSIKNRRTKRAFRTMLESASPNERQFIPMECGIVRLKRLGADLAVDASLASWIEDFKSYAVNHPEALLKQYFFGQS